MRRCLFNWLLSCKAAREPVGLVHQRDKTTRAEARQSRPAHPRLLPGLRSHRCLAAGLACLAGSPPSSAHQRGAPAEKAAPSRAGRQIRMQMRPAKRNYSLAVMIPVAKWCASSAVTCCHTSSQPEPVAQSLGTESTRGTSAFLSSFHTKSAPAILF